jgi:hypothetical protein
MKVSACLLALLVAPVLSFNMEVGMTSSLTFDAEGAATEPKCFSHWSKATWSPIRKVMQVSGPSLQLDANQIADACETLWLFFNGLLFGFLGSLLVSWGPPFLCAFGCFGFLSAPLGSLLVPVAPKMPPKRSPTTGHGASSGRDR